MNTTVAPSTLPIAPTSRYLVPGRPTRWIVNPIISGLVTLGLPLKGARVLSVRGRSTGEWRTVPVNPLTLDGEQFLVAPRGETQWVRNLQSPVVASCVAAVAAQPFTAVELDDTAKPTVLRAYLEQWAWEVGAFFAGVGADSSDEELARIAPDHPVFRIMPV